MVVGSEGRDLDPSSRRLTNLRLMIGAVNPGTKGLQPRMAAKGLQAAFTQAFYPTFWEKLTAGRARKNSIRSAP